MTAYAIKNILFSYIKIFSNLSEEMVLQNETLLLLQNTIPILLPSEVHDGKTSFRNSFERVSGPEKLRI